MAEEFSTTRIKSDTLFRLRVLAKQGKRSPVEQLDLMVEAFERMGVISFDVLPRPKGAKVFPVVTVQAQA